MEPAGRKIVLGVTGGIAAYKSAYLTRLLVKSKAEVQVIMTEAGAKFVTPLTFESLTNRDVAVQMFPEKRFISTRHITMAKWPDLIVIAPATADFIAQYALGMCPSLLSAVVCATKKPVVIAPAMNDGMYQNEAVQENIQKLRDRGVIIAEAGTGEMACDSFGPGRMAEPDEIFDLICTTLSTRGPLSGKKVLVTAGPCRESLDPVRYISNRSSGKMGFEIALQAQKLGADVSLVTGPVALPDLPGIETVRVETTEEMAHAVEDRFATCDYLVMAAAPADYKPKISFKQKMKKCDIGIMVDFEPTIDILKHLATSRKETQTVIGFSLETENELENSRKKLTEKKLDYIVINNPLEDGAGFETETNRVTILSATGETKEIGKANKDIVARQIWEYVLDHAV